MTAEFRTKLRKLGEKYYGNELYGEHLAYQHELQGLIDQYAIDARAVDVGNAHELLMAYGKVCEEEGCLSERAVTIRMDLATYYNDKRLEKERGK